MDIIYGPVASWRLGSSLGVDLICSRKKICSFECSYCQLMETEEHTTKRRDFISIKKLEEELTDALVKTKPDVITLSGTGEPTLAKNMDKAIEKIKELSDLPIAILTNSTLLYLKEVRNSLKKIDIIVAKFDASNQEIFEKINHPVKEIDFKKTYDGILKMKKEFDGKFATQSMFIDKNKEYADEIANLTRKINPDEVQINTPLRPCKEKPLSVKELDEIEKKFRGLNTINVYHSEKPMTDPLDKIELFKRRRMEK